MRVRKPAARIESTSGLLEQRLLNRAREAGPDLNRLRRRVVFERVLLRLLTSQQGM